MQTQRCIEKLERELVTARQAVTDAQKQLREALEMLLFDSHPLSVCENFRPLPTSKRVGQIDACALVLLQRRIQSGQQRRKLQVRHHKRRGQDLEAIDALRRRPPQLHRSRRARPLLA